MNSFQNTQVYITPFGQKMLKALMAKNNQQSMPSTKNLPPMDPHGRLTGLKSDGVPTAHAADPLKSPEDIKHIQEYFLRRNEIRNYTLFNLGICFGLRIGDLLSLHFSDLMTSKSTFKQYLEIYEDKTNKRNRIFIVPMVISTMKLYIDYLEETEGFRLTDYLFKSRKTRWNEYSDEQQSPITPQAVHTILKKAAKDLGLQGNISTHTLRKTFSYWSLKLNEGNTEALYTLQSALNHSDTRVTLKYAGISQDNVDHLRSDVSNFFEVESKNAPLHPSELPQTAQFSSSEASNVKLPSKMNQCLQSDLGQFPEVLCTKNSNIEENDQNSIDISLSELNEIPDYILVNPHQHLAEIKQGLAENKYSEAQAALILRRMNETR